MGFSVSRNPIPWLGMWLWGFCLIFFTIFIYPFVLFGMWVGFINYAKKGNYAEITDQGIGVTTSQGKTISQHPWNEIAEVSMQFEPPAFFPVLHLVNGNIVHLHCASTEELLLACRDRGIKVNDK